MTDPLVSIITPTLNQARFIGQTLRSVRHQTYPNVEHIVVDGGSTDGTIEILREAEAEHGLMWQSGPDRSMYEAINKGLRLASGEIVAYLNSDDIYPPWAIEVAVNAFSLWPDAGVVFGDGLTIDEDTGRQRLSFVPPFDRKSLALVGSLVQPAVFLRRATIVEYGGFSEALSYVGDLELWLRIGATTRFQRVDEVLAIERTHAAALSRSAVSRMAIEEMGVRSTFITPGRLPLSRLIARVRGALWRRRLWARFLMTARSNPRDGSRWARFATAGDLAISPARVALAQIPRFGARFAWNAVRSRRAWLGPPRPPNQE